MPTTEAAIETFGFSQLYANLGETRDDGSTVVRLWWKPLVTLIWLGGLLIALGGALALLGRVIGERKRAYVKYRIAERRAEEAAL